MDLKKQAEDVAKAAEAKKEEGKEEQKQDGFVKADEKVDAGKFNQALRKAREAEAEKLELEKEKLRLESLIKGGNPEKKKEEPKKEPQSSDEEEDFWGAKPPEKKAPAVVNPDDIKAIINEQIRPFVESEANRKKVERKQARQAFYDNHPEYLSDADKWAELLEELGSSIVPSGDYYQDLEKAHRIIGGENFTKVQIEQKKKDFASDAGGGDGGNSSVKNNGVGYQLSTLDKKIIEGTGVDAETIKKMRQMQKDGLLSLEF